MENVIRELEWWANGRRSPWPGYGELSIRLTNGSGWTPEAMARVMLAKREEAKRLRALLAKMAAAVAATRVPDRARLKEVLAEVRAELADE